MSQLSAKGFLDPGQADAYIQALLDLLGTDDPIDVLTATPERLKRELITFPPAKLRTPEAPGKWSAFTIFAHLADTELVSSFRVRMILAQDKPDLATRMADGIGAGVSRPRRRITGQYRSSRGLHDPAVDNPPNATGPVASVKLGDDGSMAAFVPARRALTWHLTDPTGASVVKERYWLTFQPGEIRTCTSCHGINTKDQANHPTPTNSPAALRTLLQYWKTKTGDANPKITSAIRLANGQTQLRMKGIPSKVHIIQTTMDLVHWLPIGTNLTDSNVLFQFDDANAGSFPARFYRLVIP